jgi:hypothetical protein
MDESDQLLAIIHGFGPNGWRDPEAQQTYLVKNAVGNRMRAESWKEFLARTKTQGPQSPKLHGDIIHGTVAGRTGFVYFNGAYYYWFDPRNKKLPPSGGAFHGRSTETPRRQ